MLSQLPKLVQMLSPESLPMHVCKVHSVLEKVIAVCLIYIVLIHTDIFRIEINKSHAIRDMKMLDFLPHCFRLFHVACFGSVCLDPVCCTILLLFL